MKILYVITGLGGGGAEKVVSDLADKMYERGHNVKIAYLKGEIVVKPKNSEIELVYLGLESVTEMLKASLKLKKLINIFQPSIVHAHMVHANIFVRLNRFFYKIPKLVCTAHNSNEGGKIRMLAYKYTNFLSDQNTNVSREATESLINLGAFSKKNITTIYNGIDINKFYKIPNLKDNFLEKVNLSPDTKILLAVGRFHDQKDYPNLIRAVSILKNDFCPKPFHLFIAGEGELRKSLENLIESYKLSEQITLLGRRDDIPALMSTADIFVLSSKFEGFGLVVAEAMACECFVVATDCGGVSEVMGENGILVPPENSEALAKGLSNALSMSDSLSLENNSSALNYVKKTFNLDKIIDQWIQLYDK